MTSIEVRDLVLQRKAGFRLGPLSLHVAPGSRTALVGPSGCGKTTLLRCLAGLETPDSGTIAFGDRVVHDGRVRVPASDRRIGFVFQDGALWPHLTATEQLRFVQPQLTREGARALLARVGLAELADRRPGALSGGEGQRLALARALAGDPEVLMLDEPLHSVDVHLRDELSLLIRRVAEERGLTLLVVTHDRDEALAMANELVVLRDGSVVEAGSASDLLREPRTAYAASFLCRAACLRARARGGGLLETVFGLHEGPHSQNGSVALVLLPGDVTVASEGPEARVLQVFPMQDTAMATVELAGHTVQVMCDPSARPGMSMTVALRGLPRFLPTDREGEAT